MEHSRKNEKYEKVSSPIINCQYVGVMLTSIVSHLNVYI